MGKPKHLKWLNSADGTTIQPFTNVYPTSLPRLSPKLMRSDLLWMKSAIFLLTGTGKSTWQAKTNSDTIKMTHVWLLNKSSSDSIDGFKSTRRTVKRLAMPSSSSTLKKSNNSTSYETKCS